MLQHFIEETVSPLFSSKTQPTLCYMGKILPEISAYPRIMHSHENHVEISIIYSGTSRYLIGDRKQLIQPGDIIIYNSGVAHDELSGPDTQIGSYFFAISNIALPGLRPNALLADNVTPVFHVEQDFQTLLGLCETMLQQMEQLSEWTRYLLHFETQALLEIVWRSIYHERNQQEGKTPYYLGQKIKEYIDEHYHEPISIKNICQDLGLSESYVSHTFKDMLGYSPMQYALRCKIGEAQTLLISTDYSITEIAHMVGFDAQSHFNQRFIKYVGISPSKFRKNYRNR